MSTISQNSFLSKILSTSSCETPLFNFVKKELSLLLSFVDKSRSKDTVASRKFLPPPKKKEEKLKSLLMKIQSLPQILPSEFLILIERKKMSAHMIPTAQLWLHQEKKMKLLYCKRKLKNIWLKFELKLQVRRKEDN